jgi:hypothetical protein
MATIPYTGVKVKGDGLDDTVVSWTGLATGDDGQPVQMPAHPNRSVQVNGTFAGASVTIQGSNDGLNYFTLNDPQGNPLVFVAAKIEQLLETTRYVRPIVTGGAGLALIVSLQCART